MTTRRQSLLAHALLLAVVVVWGATFGLVKNALRDCSPLLFNALRMLLAFGFLAALHAREWKRVTRAAVTAGAVAGFFLALGYGLQTVGLTQTTPVRSAFLTGLVVVLVPALCIWPALRPAGMARPGALPLVSAAGAFCGIVLLTAPAGVPLQEFTHALNRGDVLSFFCAVAFALHLLSLAHLARSVPTAQLATLQIGVAAVLLSVATPLLETPRLHLETSSLMTLLVCAFLGTAAAFSIQSWAQRHLQANHAALLLALEPAFALLTSLLFFGEHLSLRSGVGAALILCSLLLGEMLSPAPVSEQPEANGGEAGLLPSASTHTIAL